MTTERRNDQKTLRITAAGMMAAIIFVGNYLRIPFMGTRLTAANALCVLSGLLFGPAAGFLSAGIGSFLYDIVTGYGAESLITLASKGTIGLVAGLIGFKPAHGHRFDRQSYVLIFFSAAAGAFAYVLLYMLKTVVFGLMISGLTMDATMIRVASKLPGSVINAVFATIAGPLMLAALRPAMLHSGLFSEG